MTWGGYFGQKAKDIGINLKAVVVPIIAIVATIATGGAAAGLIGTTVLETVGVSTAIAESTIIGTATVASTVGGAVLGAGTSALSAAINDQKIAKAALVGGVTGGVGALASGAVSGALGGQNAVSAVGPEGPQIPSAAVAPTIAGSTALGAAATKGAGGLIGGTTGALAGGANLSSALRTGAISGASGGLSAGLSEALGLSNYGLPGQIASGLLGPAISYELGKTFPAGSKSSSGSSGSSGGFGISGGSSGTSSTATTGTFSPGASQLFQLAGSPSALGSALFSVPGIGYSPSGPVLGGAGGEDKAPKNVWSDTDKSLRDVGTTVT
jgi:hypothetical protein